MELWPGVHLVGSGRNGFDLTDSYDCHVYLIDAGEEAALIDAGCGVDADPLCREIDRLDARRRLRKLILSHKHADHAGGAALLRERYGLTVIASQHTADVVSQADEARMSLPEAKAAGGYPPDFVFRPCPVDIAVGEGDTIRIGKFTLRVVETPGHCEGHLAFIGEVGGRSALFSADSLFHGGRVVWQATYDCSVQDHVASIRKLAELSFDALLPGHLAISLQRGKRHAEAALERIARLELPRHLV